MASWVFVEKMAIKEIVELEELWALLDQQALLVQLVQQARRVRLGLEEPLVETVLMVSKARRVTED